MYDVLTTHATSGWCKTHEWFMTATDRWPLWPMTRVTNTSCTECHCSRLLLLAGGGIQRNSDGEVISVCRHAIDHRKHYTDHATRLWTFIHYCVLSIRPRLARPTSATSADRLHRPTKRKLHGCWKDPTTRTWVGASSVGPTRDTDLSSFPGSARQLISFHAATTISVVYLVYLAYLTWWHLQKPRPTDTIKALKQQL